jgi:hypothetical protein
MDGVMNNKTDFFEMQKYGHPHNKGGQVINRGILAILQTLIENTDAKIVFTTAWRKELRIDDLHHMFTTRGWELPRDVMVGITPVLYRNNIRRGAEILKYKEEHPEIEVSVIFDDNVAGIEEYGFKPLVVEPGNITGDFIETHTDSGLTIAQAFVASLALGLNDAAIARNEQRQKDLDIMIGCMT